MVTGYHHDEIVSSLIFELDNLPLTPVESGPYHPSWA